MHVKQQHPFFPTLVADHFVYIDSLLIPPSNKFISFAFVSSHTKFPMFVVSSTITRAALCRNTRLRRYYSAQPNDDSKKLIYTTPNVSLVKLAKLFSLSTFGVRPNATIYMPNHSHPVSFPYRSHPCRHQL